MDRDGKLGACESCFARIHEEDGIVVPMPPFDAWVCLRDKLHFCCGDPESVYIFVRDLLERFDEQTTYLKNGEENPRYVEANQVQLVKALDFDRPIGFAITYWLTGAGLLDHGIACRLSNLSDKGYSLLATMRVHTYEELKQLAEDE